MNIGQDIKLKNGDITINAGSGDFADVSETDVLEQDILEEFGFPYLDDLDNPDRGSIVTKLLNNDTDDELEILAIEGEIKRQILRDSRVYSKSVIIQREENQGDVKFSIGFKSVTGGSVLVRLGEN